MAQASQFVISKFTNPSGEIGFRVTGWLDGKRIRKNFPTRADDFAERQALDIQRVQSETSVHTTLTRLTEEKLHENESAFRRLAVLTKSLSFYLDFDLANYRAPDRVQSLVAAVNTGQCTSSCTSSGNCRANHVTAMVAPVPAPRTSAAPACKPAQTSPTVLWKTTAATQRRDS